MKLNIGRGMKIDVLVFVLIWLLSFFCRTMVYEREAVRVAALAGIEQPKSGHFVPFTIESAMAFNYANQIGSGELNILGPDLRLSGLGKVSVNRQFNVGNEYFLGYGYRLKKMLFGSPELKEEDKVYEDDPYFSSWVRFQLRLWVSLSSALIFLCLRIMGVPDLLSVVGGILHCVSPAAIARYTGQDIVGGAFSMPFLLSTLAAALAYMRRMSTVKFAIFLVSGFIAIATWDMVQVVFSAFALFELLRIMMGGGTGRARSRLWLGMFILSIIASVIVPYHQKHLLIFSPLLLFLMPSVLLAQRFYRTHGFSWVRVAKIAGIAISFFILSSFIGKISSYSENYSHFGELMMAKFKFMNVKPKDPSLLSFDARVLWTPAMHSADSKILKSYFPAALYLVPIIIASFFFLSAFISDFYGAIKFRLGWIYINLSIFIFYFLAFFFIVRYHVFLAVFLCFVLPQLAYVIFRQFRQASLAGSIARFAAWTFIIAAILFEMFMSLMQVRQYDRYFFGEVSSLIKWCRREGVSNKIFLADFEISPMLLAYCRAGILLQPKFELGLTRRNFEHYIRIAYHGTERDLMKFCESNFIDYYVYDVALAGPMGIYSCRYFANAHKLSENSPVARMS
ncbi:MAG TPA: hypothetical protein PK821_06570, partial [Victivallales bacterium]|nr:hypothetical protein [Victivallales bacterium]